MGNNRKSPSIPPYQEGGFQPPSVPPTPPTPLSGGRGRGGIIGENQQTLSI